VEIINKAAAAQKRENRSRRVHAVNTLNRLIRISQPPVRGKGREQPFARRRLSVIQPSDAERRSARKRLEGRGPFHSARAAMVAAGIPEHSELAQLPDDVIGPARALAAFF